MTFSETRGCFNSITFPIAPPINRTNNLTSNRRYLSLPLGARHMSPGVAVAAFGGQMTLERP